MRTLRLIAAMAALVASMAFAVVAVASHPEVSLPGSNFEIDTDANLKLDDPAPSLDWASVAEIRKADKPSGATDDSFGQGSKEDDPVPTVVDGSIPPNKSDLLNFGAYLETTATGQRFLNLFWHRVQEPSGTTNMDFEFNQSGTLSANGVTPVRTAGDLLIQYDLSQGGTNPILSVSRWVTSGAASQCEASNSLPCWSAKVNLTAAGDAAGSINTSAIPAAQSDGLGAISPRTFGEAQLDFDALTGGSGQCVSFGSVYLKSRSSDSFTSELKDFIAPTAVSISNCATVRIRKQTVPEEDPNATDFGFTKSFPTQPATANTFTLQDDGVQSYSGNVVLGADYTVDEDVVPAGWSLTDIDCAVEGHASTGVTPVVSVANGTVTFSLDSASDVLDCTYTNTKDAQVTIVKDAVPNDAQDFGFGGDFGVFELDDDADPTLDDERTFTVSGTGFGPKTVSEDDVAGWDLTDITCSEGSDAGRTASLQVDPGDDIRCVFTNTKRGVLEVEKQTSPDDPKDEAAQDKFGYTADLPGTGDDAFELDDDDVRSVVNIVPGTYTVTEDDPTPGYVLTGLTCNDGGSDTPSTTSVATRTATFEVDPGETVRCTFTNTKDAHVTIVKDAVPNDAQDFGFGGDFGAFDLDDDADPTLDDERSFTVSGSGFGEKSVSEDDPTPGWDLTDLQCSEGAENVATRTATLQVDPGDAITCTFTNTKRGVLEVEKQTSPDDPKDEAAQDKFGYSAQLPGTGDDVFELDDDDVRSVVNVVPGTYSVTEDDPSPAYSLTALSCDDGQSATPSTTSLGSRTATFEVDPGETVRCTFTNTKQGTIEVEKQTDPDDPKAEAEQDKFGYASELPGAGNDAFELDDDDVKSVLNVAPGSYSVTEDDPTPGYDLTGLTCSDGQSATPSTTNVDTRTAVVKLDPGESVRCVFTNTKRGVLEVEKQTDPADPKAEAEQDKFGYTAGLPGDADDAFVLDDDDVKSVANIVPGSYAVSEDDPTPGYDLTGLTCDDGQSATPSTTSLQTRTATFEVDPGETVRCTFTNTKRGSVTVHKTEGELGLPEGSSWTFTLDGVERSTDAGGDVAWVDLPAGSHTLCEVNIPEGWFTDLAQLPGAVVSAVVGGVYSVCVTFTLANGETRAFAVDNFMPAIRIVKTASSPFAYVGDTVTYTLKVTNVGVGALRNVVVEDAEQPQKCNSAPVFQGGDSDADSELDESETWTYTCSHVVTAADADPLVNVARATGEDKNGNEVSDEDDASVDILHQRIDIEKTGPATANVGDALNYTLTVTNPGDTAFPAQQVIVTDPKCEAPPAGPNTGSDATPGTLDPGDTWTYTCTAQTAGQPAGTFVNTANVAGKDVNGRDATDTDDFPTVLNVVVVLPEAPGSARLRGPSGCVRGPFDATVRGTRITRVTFLVDGKRFRVLTAPTRGDRFTVRINPRGRGFGVHRVTARVEFETASGTRARTLRLSFQRCRKQVVRPRFTG